ncbi:hypothetical protein TNCV_4592191 [Trichonephila clavipes]|nr:hypothetical protein TNCV_4592191 [Trichonephila clavipes]
MMLCLAFCDLPQHFGPKQLYLLSKDVKLNAGISSYIKYKVSNQRDRCQMQSPDEIQDKASSQMPYGVYSSDSKPLRVAKSVVLDWSSLEYRVAPSCVFGRNTFGSALAPLMSVCLLDGG